MYTANNYAEPRGKTLTLKCPRAVLQASTKRLDKATSAPEARK